MTAIKGAVGNTPAAPPNVGDPMVEWAEWYATVLGWPVFPVKPKGKAPITAHGLLDATTDLETIQAWWATAPDANIGSPYPSVLDCDLPRGSDPGDGVKAYRRLEAKHGVLAGVAIARSGGDGLHVFYSPGAPAGKVGPGLSMRGSGLYAVLPPSEHESGRRYMWERPPIGGYPLPPAPLWLTRRQATAAKKLKTTVFETNELIPINARHDAIAAYVGGLRRRNAALTADEARVLAHAFRVERCEAPEEKAGDVDDLIAYVYAKEPVEDETWTGATPDGAALLDEIELHVRRYMRMSDHEHAVVSLYVVLTYLTEHVEVVPYLRVVSATKRSGKSRLLGILEMIVDAPLPSGGMSEAALFRSLAERARTVLLDEAGRILSAAQRDKNSDLQRVFLNGFTRGVPVQRCVGKGASQAVVDFEVFGPKILSGTGQLDDQILDRCLPIELRRKKGDEAVERFRRRGAKAATAELRAKIAAWADAHAQQVADARPSLPEQLDDRGQDIAEPLLAIADAAGGAWPQTARAALVALRGDSDEAEEDVGVELILDIAKAFADDARLSTEDLLRRLTDDAERPWAHWSKGLPMNAMQLARKLKTFGIKPRLLKFAGVPARGYVKADFADAVSRYAPSSAVLPVTPVTLAQPSRKEADLTRYPEPSGNGSENGANPHGHSEVTGTTGQDDKQGGEHEQTLDEALLDPAFVESLSAYGSFVDES